MKRSNRLVILVGILLAIVAFVLVVILLNRPEAPVETPPTTTTVLVATRDIAVDEELSVDDVEPRVVDLAAVEGTPFADVSQVAGERSRVNIAQGAQVTQEDLGLAQAGTGVVDFAEMLQPGERAVSFQVDRATGLDFLLREGDVVDIVISEEITGVEPEGQPTPAPEETPDPFTRFGEQVPDANDQRTVKAVIQSRRVLYVSETRNQPAPTPDPNAPAGQAPPPAETVPENVIVVIAATDQEAELLKFAQRDINEIGSISVLLRSPDDADPAVTTGITLRRLVDDYGLLVPILVEATDDNS